MNTAARTMHSLAGEPTQAVCEDHAAACVVCGARALRTAPYARWQGATFTDQNKLRGHGLSDRVCEPCVWAHSWVAPPDRPANEPGKKGLNLRLFSHMWSECDGYRSLNKADKPAIREWLRARVHGERWWCAIADSGQKHTVPWVREQRRAHGVVRFEERDVEVGDWALLDAMTAALTAGVTKSEIESGEYSPRAWQLAESHVRELLGHPERDGGWWTLCVWLAQRDEGAVAARLAAEKAAKAARKKNDGGRGTEKRGSARGRSGARAGGEAGIPGSGRKRARPLEPPARQAPGSSSHQRDDGADGDGVPPRPATWGAQLGLFGGVGEADGDR